MDSWEKYRGQRVTVYFDDGFKVTPKPGVLEDSNSEFVFLKTDRGSEALQIGRIVRIELSDSTKFKNLGGFGK